MTNTAKVLYDKSSGKFRVTVYGGKTQLWHSREANEQEVLARLRRWSVPASAVVVL